MIIQLYSSILKPYWNSFLSHRIKQFSADIKMLILRLKLVLLAPRCHIVWLFIFIFVENWIEYAIHNFQYVSETVLNRFRSDTGKNFLSLSSGWAGWGCGSRPVVDSADTNVLKTCPLTCSACSLAAQYHRALVTCCYHDSTHF